MIENLKQAIKTEFGLEWMDLRKKNKHEEIALVRHAALVFMRRVMEMSTTKAARELMRNHATAIHSEKCIDRAFQGYDPKLLATYERLIKAVQE